MELQQWYGSALASPGDFPVKIVLVGQPGLITRAGALAQGYQFNAMHAALQIGPVLIDWCDNSLVYPREVKVHKAFVAIEIGELKIPQHNAEVQQVGLSFPFELSSWRKIRDVT